MYQVKSIFVILVLIALSSMSLGDKMFAFAILAPNGTFFCDPTNINLEKASYKHVVGFLNGGIVIDEKLYPNMTEQQLHNNLIEAIGISGHNSVDLYNQEHLCLTNNGVDPDSIATLSAETMKALNYNTTIPEFSSVVGLVTVIAITSVIVVTRKF